MSYLTACLQQALNNHNTQIARILNTVDTFAEAEIVAARLREAGYTEITGALEYYHQPYNGFVLRVAADPKDHADIHHIIDQYCIEKDRRQQCSWTYDVARISPPENQPNNAAVVVRIVDKF